MYTGSQYTPIALSYMAYFYQPLSLKFCVLSFDCIYIYFNESNSFSQFSSLQTLMFFDPCKGCCVVSEPHAVFILSLRICLISLAPSHPLIAQNKLISKLNFQVDEHTNRLENKVSGKGKRVGMLYIIHSRLAS